VSAGRGPIALGAARIGIEVRQFVRERDSMVFTFAFPVILLCIFGSVFSGNVGRGVSFTQYFTAGMIASGIVLSSFQSLAIGIAVERDEGSLKRLRGTPMPQSAYFLGKIGLVLVTSVVQTVILLLIGMVLFGLNLPTAPGIWLRFTWIFVLGTAAGTVLGIAYSAVPRSSRSAASVVSPVVIVLQFISGVLFKYNDLPRLDADDRRAVPTQVVGTGDAVSVPAQHLPGRRSRWVLATAPDRAGAGCLDRGRAAGRVPDIPVGPSRRGLGQRVLGAEAEQFDRVGDVGVSSGLRDPVGPRLDLRPGHLDAASTLTADEVMVMLRIGDGG